LGSKQKKKLTRGKRSSFITQKSPRLKSMPVALFPYQTLLLVDDNAYLANVRSISGVNQRND
jgi:uncharacterized protein (DUF2132 family)